MAFIEYFVAGYHNNGSATTLFMVNASKEATYKIKIRYAAGFGSSKLLGFYVNTEKVKVLECAGTMEWSAWATHSESVKLMAGMNAIVLKAESATGAPVNIDNSTTSAMIFFGLELIG